MPLGDVRSGVRNAVITHHAGLSPAWPRRGRRGRCWRDPGAWLGSKLGHRVEAVCSVRRIDDGAEMDRSLERTGELTLEGDHMASAGSGSATGCSDSGSPPQVPWYSIVRSEHGSTIRREPPSSADTGTVVLLTITIVDVSGKPGNPAQALSARRTAITATAGRRQARVMSTSVGADWL